MRQGNKKKESWRGKEKTFGGVSLFFWKKIDKKSGKLEIKKKCLCWRWHATDLAITALLSGLGEQVVV